MARKVLNRKELRAENDAAEAQEGAGAEAKPKKKAKAAAAPGEAKVKRKSRAKTAKEVRLKAFWGVFNQSMKRVALFEHSQRRAALKKAEELSASQKTPHFVQLQKEPIAE